MNKGNLNVKMKEMRSTVDYTISATDKYLYF